MYKSLYTGCSFGKKPPWGRSEGWKVKWGKEGEPAQARMAEWATSTDTGHGALKQPWEIGLRWLRQAFICWPTPHSLPMKWSPHEDRHLSILFHNIWAPVDAMGSSSGVPETAQGRGSGSAGLRPDAGQLYSGWSQVKSCVQLVHEVVTGGRERWEGF